MAHFQILSVTHTTKWIKSFFDMMNFNMTRCCIVLNQSMKYICTCCCSHAWKEFFFHDDKSIPWVQGVISYTYNACMKISHTFSLSIDNKHKLTFQRRSTWKKAFRKKWINQTLNKLFPHFPWPLAPHDWEAKAPTPPLCTHGPLLNTKNSHTIPPPSASHLFLLENGL